MRSAPDCSNDAVAGDKASLRRRPCRSPTSQPSRELRASAWRAACAVYPIASNDATSVSCHTAARRGRTYSPRIVNKTLRAAGAPTDRRRSCSFTGQILVGHADIPGCQRELAQLEALHLPGDRAGEVVDERNDVGVLVAAQAALAPLAQLVGELIALCRSRSHDHERLHAAEV